MIPRRYTQNDSQAPADWEGAFLDQLQLCADLNCRFVFFNTRDRCPKCGSQGFPLQRQSERAMEVVSE